jgi:hypothetical protein
MSKIALTPSATGTGVFTISSPATNTNRTLTLPDEAGTVLTSASSLASANLTGALPAISGAALTGIATGMVYDLLGTIASASGSSITISGLDLTSYKFLHIIMTGGSHDTINFGGCRLNGWPLFSLNFTSTSDVSSGIAIVQLTDGVYLSSGGIARADTSTNESGTGGGLSGLSTASTSITINANLSGAFTAGTFKFYGVA